MSRATLYVLFPGGLVRYGIYNGTVDIANAALFATVDEAWDASTRGNHGYNAKPMTEPVKVRVATDYGGGFSWNGTATPELLTSGHEPWTEDGAIDFTDGLPAWLHTDDDGFTEVNT